MLGNLEQSSPVPTGAGTFSRNVVVIDFGLARDFKKYSTGVMGTPGYMPPEAASLEQDVGVDFVAEASLMEDI